MKNPDRNTVSRLDALPNIGKAVSADLNLLGIDHPKQLIGSDPFKLYEDLCVITGQRQDPCLLDVFISAVDFMNGGDPQPWWAFSEQRKKALINSK